MLRLDFGLVLSCAAVREAHIAVQLLTNRIEDLPRSPDAQDRRKISAVSKLLEQRPESTFCSPRKIVFYRQTVRTSAALGLLTEDFSVSARRRVRFCQIKKKSLWVIGTAIMRPRAIIEKFVTEAKAHTETHTAGGPAAQAFRGG